MYCVVILQAKNKILVVPINWVQNPNASNVTKIFLSKNINTKPDFNLKTYYFIQEFDACYNGFVLKACDTQAEGERIKSRYRHRYPVDYIESKVRTCPKVFEHIDLTDSQVLITTPSTLNVNTSAQTLNNELPTQNVVNMQQSSNQTGKYASSSHATVPFTSERNRVPPTGDLKAQVPPKKEQSSNQTGKYASSSHATVPFTSERNRDPPTGDLKAQVPPKKEQPPNQTSKYASPSHAIVPLTSEKKNDTSTGVKPQNPSKIQAKFHSRVNHYYVPSLLTSSLAMKTDLSHPYQGILTAMENLRKTIVSMPTTVPQTNINTRCSTSKLQEFKTEPTDLAMEPKKICDGQTVASKMPKLHHTNIVPNPFSNQSSGFMTKTNQPPKQTSKNASPSHVIIPFSSERIPDTSAGGPKAPKNQAKLHSHTKPYGMPSSSPADKKSDSNDPLRVISNSMENRRRTFDAMQTKLPQTCANTQNFTSNSQQYKIEPTDSAEISFTQCTQKTVRSMQSCNEQNVVSKLPELHHTNILLNRFNNPSRGTLAQTNEKSMKTDTSFACNFGYLTNIFGDRYYMDADIKIKRDTVTILKNMNINVLQSAKEFDYSFVSRLLVEVFDTPTLCKETSKSVNAKKTAYAQLDQTKYKFIESVFAERIKGKTDESQRKTSLPNLINKKCAQLRNNLRK